MSFTHLMVPLVTKLRQFYRVLVYLDDFPICPAKAGGIAIVRDCRRATKTIDNFLSSLGLERLPTKGEWNASTGVEHLGCVIDTVSMRLFSLDGPEWVVKPRCLSSSCSLFLREAGIYNARLLRLCTITVFIHQYCAVATIKL
jgi:hypothetical protein